MDKKYLLKNALGLNATNEKFDAIAEPIDLAEIKKNKKHFGFDFSKLKQEDFFIYKMCKVGESDILQGLVAFKPSLGILECGNMETSKTNRGENSIYSGIGKAIIALCCKISFDNGMDGFITFDAKNHLFPYYKRYGAKLMYGNRMAIENVDAKELVDIYF